MEFRRKVPEKPEQETAVFANGDGGYLLAGFDDNGTILGTDLKAAQDTIASVFHGLSRSPGKIHETGIAIPAHPLNHCIS